jgi:hypothetical protein
MRALGSLRSHSETITAASIPLPLPVSRSLANQGSGRESGRFEACAAVGSNAIEEARPGRPHGPRAPRTGALVPAPSPVASGGNSCTRPTADRPGI